MQRNPSPSQRRLKDMSPVQAPEPWAPPLPVDGADYVETFPISQDVKYLQRIGYDELNRIAEWAVVQLRREGKYWRQIAVYDACHGKGYHLHILDKQEQRCAEIPLGPVDSYRDFVRALDDAVVRVAKSWRENEGRSERGC